MDLQTYVPLALRTEKLLATPVARLNHAALGIVSETGELATVVKRVMMYGKPMDEVGKDGKTLRMHMREEIGDVCWYVVVGADALGIDITLVAPRYEGMVLAMDDIVEDLATYGGRFCEAVRSMKRLNLAAVPPTERAFLNNTTANILRLLSSFCTAVGCSLGDLLDENVEKLRERFPDAYSDQAAEARLDKGGLDARNS